MPLAMPLARRRPRRCRPVGSDGEAHRRIRGQKNVELDGEQDAVELLSSCDSVTRGGDYRWYMETIG